ncbi:MAG: hypothetical protein JW806_03605 [Sedimentisphaerales bacterium]|nr:hypothetical protein [Sedimentisphaerales bacterium]
MAITRENLKNLGFDKIALLIMLIVGLLLAKIIVFSRGKFQLSEPIKLQGTGVTVSVPAGGGFIQDIKGFQYDDDEFRLTSALHITGNSAISITWRYFILPTDKTDMERFQIQADGINGEIEKTGSEKFGQFLFNYARIFAAKNPILVLSGTTRLPDGRALSLEVMQKGFIADIAEKIFETTIASVNYTQDNPLEKGRQILSGFRQNSLADMLQKKGEQNYYYIQNYTNKILGFTCDYASIRNNDSEPNSLTAVSFYFFKPGLNTVAEQTVFNSNPDLKNFKWASLQKDSLTRRQISTGIELDNQNKLSISKGDKIQNITFTTTMLPEIFLNVFIKNFLQSNYDSVMIDLVLSDGRIRPAVISRAELQKDTPSDIVFAADVVLLGTTPIKQTVLLDRNLDIISSKVQGRLSYKLQKTKKENVVAAFPEHAENINAMEDALFQEFEKL